MGTAMYLVMNDEALEAVQRLVPIAEGLGLTLPQMALAWVLRRPELASAIVGASRPEQVHANASASGIELSADVLARDRRGAWRRAGDGAHAGCVREGGRQTPLTQVRGSGNESANPRATIANTGRIIRVVWIPIASASAPSAVAISPPTPIASPKVIPEASPRRAGRYCWPSTTVVENGSVQREADQDPNRVEPR